MNLKMKLLVVLFLENIFLAVEKGMEEAVEYRYFGRYPVVDVKVTVY